MRRSTFPYLHIPIKPDPPFNRSIRHANKTKSTHHYHLNHNIVDAKVLRSSITILASQCI